MPTLIPKERVIAINKEIQERIKGMDFASYWGMDDEPVVKSSFSWTAFGVGFVLGFWVCGGFCLIINHFIVP